MSCGQSILCDAQLLKFWSSCPVQQKCFRHFTRESLGGMWRWGITSLPVPKVFRDLWTTFYTQHNRMRRVVGSRIGRWCDESPKFEDLFTWISKFLSLYMSQFPILRSFPEFRTLTIWGFLLVSRKCFFVPFRTECCLSWLDLIQRLCTLTVFNILQKSCPFVGPCDCDGTNFQVFG